MAEDGRFATYDTRIDPYLTPPPHPRLLTRGAASKPQRLRSTLSSKRSASVFMSNQPDTGAWRRRSALADLWRFLW